MAGFATQKLAFSWRELVLLLLSGFSAISNLKKVNQLSGSWSRTTICTLEAEGRSLYLKMTSKHQDLVLAQTMDEVVYIFRYYSFHLDFFNKHQCMVLQKVGQEGQWKCLVEFSEILEE